MKPVVMKGSDYLKEHRELIGLLGNTSKALRNEALTQTKELTKELMKNPTRKNALALAKRGSSNLGKRMTTRGNRLVLRKGNVMGKGFDDVISHYHKVQDAKEAEKAKEYAERKSRIENADNDFRAMVAKYGAKGNVGNGLFGDLFEDAIVEGGKKLYQFDKSHGSHLKEGVKSGFKNMISNVFKGNGIESATRFGRGFYPDVMEGEGLLDNLRKDKRFSSLPNDDVSGWIEKERRSTGYYGKPAILGEGM
jgi:hypothetical protein